VVFTTVQNLVGIDAVVSVKHMFLFREFGLKIPIDAPKIGIFEGFTPKWEAISTLPKMYIPA